MTRKHIKKPISIEYTVARLRSITKKRDDKDLTRRLLKGLEELGEAAQAYLSMTSTHNSKNKHWPDFKEEIVDVWIIMTNILLSRRNDKRKFEHEELFVANLINTKLDKWLAKGDKDTVE